MQFHNEKVDTSDSEHVLAAVTSAVCKFERVDILVDNAGMALGALHTFGSRSWG